MHDAKVKKEREKQERHRVVEEKKRHLQVAFEVRDTFDRRFHAAHWG